MSVKLIRKEGIAIVGLFSDIDMEDVVNVKNLVTSIVADGCYRIVLDFSRVQHINATGLGILADRLRFVRSFNGDLRLAGMNPYIDHVFELTKVKALFKVFATSHEAVRSFRTANMIAA